MEKDVKLTNRRSANVTLADFCSFSMVGEKKRERDYLEVTEWSNGEGYDVFISLYNLENNTYNDLEFKLTHGQFDAIKKCIKKIEKN
jgi:hypothetical protein